jgi:hypothetical protein
MDDYEFYDEFEDYNFDHTDIFIFNHDKREIELRSELWLLYTTCVVGWTVYVVSTFLANSSMEYRRYVNRVFDTIVYDTETEMESDDSESDSGGDTESEASESETESDTYEPDEASEEEDYDIPQPDYNESNMMEGIYRLD